MATTVAKTIKFETAMSEAINSYASALGIDFSEATRRLVRYGLLSQSKSAFTGSELDIKIELNRMKGEIVREIQDVREDLLLELMLLVNTESFDLSSENTTLNLEVFEGGD